MSILVEFLLARIEEDEDAARSADGGSSGDWRRSGLASIEAVGGGSVIYSDAGQVSTEIADHIARHDPARVLAECGAKRRIVREHGPRDGGEGQPFSGNPAQRCRRCMVPGPFPCVTLRALALPYATHPDFEDEWRV